MTRRGLRPARRSTPQAWACLRGHRPSPPQSCARKHRSWSGRLCGTGDDAAARLAPMRQAIYQPNIVCETSTDLSNRLYTGQMHPPLKFERVKKALRKASRLRYYTAAAPYLCSHILKRRAALPFSSGHPEGFCTSGTSRGTAAAAAALPAHRPQHAQPGCCRSCRQYLRLPGATRSTFF